MSGHQYVFSLLVASAVVAPAFARGVANGGDAILGVDSEEQLSLTDRGLMRGWEQQEVLAEVVAGQAWRADGAAGVLRLADGTELSAEVFGTWVAKTNTFSWAWASAPSSVPATAYRQSSKARFLGGAEGYEQLTEPHQKMTRDEALALAIMAGGVLEGTHAVFLAPADFGAVMLSVTDHTIDLPEPTLGMTADILYRAIESGMVVDQKQAVRGYLEDRGFSVEGDGVLWTAQHAQTGTLQVRFSPAGRVVSISCLGAGSLECSVSDATLAAADKRQARLEGEAVASLDGHGTKKATGGVADKPDDPAVAAFGSLDSSTQEALLAADCEPGSCPGESGLWWAGYFFSN